MCQEICKKTCEKETKYVIIDAKGDIIVRGVSLKNAEILIKDIKKTYKGGLFIIEDGTIDRR